MSSGNKAINAWLERAKKENKNMRVAQEWYKGHPIGYAIWFYTPGKMEEATMMTRASSLDSIGDPETSNLNPSREPESQ